MTDRYEPAIDLTSIRAIDVHTHIEADDHGHLSLDQELMDASAAYFKADQMRTPTLDQVAQHYRERQMAAIVFTVDASTPKAPVVTAPEAGSSTPDTTPTISGTAEADVSVEALVDGESVGTTTADGTGAWSLDSTVLTEGPHTVTAVATATFTARARSGVTRTPRSRAGEP